MVWITCNIIICIVIKSGIISDQVCISDRCWVVLWLPGDCVGTWDPAVRATSCRVVAHPPRSSELFSSDISRERSLSGSCTCIIYLCIVSSFAYFFLYKMMAWLCGKSQLKIVMWINWFRYLLITHNYYRYECTLNTFLIDWTSVSDRRTFPGLRSICSGCVTTYVGITSSIGQPTRPTQPFILLGSMNE